ncbi:MAG: hypothetical protein F2789_16235, partial [Actinobacteria bacterium]|nr:hypothetical protein [Actinomycetota bacterium]
MAAREPLVNADANALRGARKKPLPPPPPQDSLPRWRDDSSRPAPGGDGQASPRHWLNVRRLAWIVVIAIAVNWFVASMLFREPSHTSISYSSFRSQVSADNIAEITSVGGSITGTLRAAIAYPPDSTTKVTDFATERPAYADDHLLDALLANDVTVNAKPVSTGVSWWVTLLANFGPALLLIGGYVWLMRRVGTGLSGIGGIGKSKAVRYDASQQRTTFADVAGID